MARLQIIQATFQTALWRRWALVTALAGMLASAIAWPISGWLFFGIADLSAALLTSILLPYALLGTILAGAHILLLRKQKPLGWSWIVVNAVGWAAAMLIERVLHGSLGDPRVGIIGGGIIAGALLGAVQSRVLFRRARQIALWVGGSCIAWVFAAYAAYLITQWQLQHGLVVLGEASQWFFRQGSFSSGMAVTSLLPNVAFWCIYAIITGWILARSL